MIESSLRAPGSVSSRHDADDGLPVQSSHAAPPSSRIAGIDDDMVVKRLERDPLPVIAV